MRKPEPTDFFIDDDLRFIPKDPEYLKNYIGSLSVELENINEPGERAKVLAEMGTFSKNINQLKDAEKYLREALSLVQENKLGIRSEIVYKIRLAHVIQYGRNFQKSDEMFFEIMEVCQKNEIAKDLLDFAWQHSGKNLFDQKKYSKALECFEKALEIRVSKKAAQDLIESSQVAVRRVRELLEVKNQ